MRENLCHEAKAREIQESIVALLDASMGIGRGADDPPELRGLTRELRDERLQFDFGMVVGDLTEPGHASPKLSRLPVELLFKFLRVRGYLALGLLISAVDEDLELPVEKV